MNNGASFNRVTVNGWLGDTSIRVQVVAFASATATAMGRVWKMSQVAGQARATNTGKLITRFARTPLVLYASAMSDAGFSQLRVVRSALQAVSSAVAEILATVRPIRFVRSALSADSTASANVTARRVSTLGQGVRSAEVVGTVVSRVFARSPISGSAQALAWVRSGSFYQVPWDEPAPDARTFLLNAESTVFTVRGNMGTVAKVKQQPGDVQDYDIDFGEWFPGDDKIASATISCTPTHPAPPSFAIEPTAKRVVKVWFYAGGTSGVDYKVTLRATTTNDGLVISPPLRTKEVELIVKVREN